MQIIIHGEADDEYRAVPERERDAMDNAIAKLREFGDQLGHPHSSAIKGSTALRELRPRAGRSPWRAFYRRAGEVMVIGAFGPEATVDPRGFDRAVQRAEERLAARETEGS